MFWSRKKLVKVPTPKYFFFCQTCSLVPRLFFFFISMFKSGSSVAGLLRMYVTYCNFVDLLRHCLRHIASSFASSGMLCLVTVAYFPGKIIYVCNFVGVTGIAALKTLLKDAKKVSTRIKNSKRYVKEGNLDTAQRDFMFFRPERSDVMEFSYPRVRLMLSMLMGWIAKEK